MDESDIETTENQSPELPAENIPEDGEAALLSAADEEDPSLRRPARLRGGLALRMPSGRSEGPLPL